MWLYKIVCWRNINKNKGISFMKKIIIIMGILAMIISCTAEDMQLWEDVKRERSERGKKCVYDYYGNIMCGYTRQNRKEQRNKWLYKY